MSKNIIIKLTEPIVGHHGPTHEVQMRPPKGGEFLRIGPVYTAATAPDGSSFYIEDKNAIEDYIRVCVIEPKDVTLLLETCSLEDAMAMKRTVLSFILGGDRATAPSQTLPETSSSTLATDASVPAT